MSKIKDFLILKIYKTDVNRIVFYLKKDRIPSHGSPTLVANTKAFRKVQDEGICITQIREKGIYL